MAFIPANQCMRIVVNQRVGSKPVKNVLHFSHNTPDDAAALQAAANAFADSWELRVAPNMATNYSFDGVTAYSMTSAEAPFYTLDLTPPVTGSQPGDALPANVAYVITLRTPTRGRSGRGRVYLAGIEEEDATAGVISGTREAALLAGFEQMRQDMISAGHQLLVLSLYANGAPRTLGSRFVVSSIDGRSTTFGTQRRRQAREASV